MRQTYPGTHLESKCSQLEDKLESEHGSEDHVEDVQSIRVDLWLPVELHRECHGVDHDQGEYRILKWLGSDEPPHFVLYSVFRYVPAHRLGL
jgi:hypothetical protein